MASHNEVETKFTADDQELEDALDNIGRRTSSLGRQYDVAIGVLAAEAFGKLLNTISAVSTATQEFLISSVQAFQFQAQAIVDLENVLKTTGGTVGFTSGQLQEMASDLQGVTTTGDEAILGIQKLLLTFTQIKGDTFADATETVLDMAAAFGTDASQAAVQLGKALNDPINGIGALKRIGVSFNEEQTKMIKQFVETNRVADAQRVILDELAVEFGGLARAQTQTVGGQVQQMKNLFGDLQEVVGGAIQPLLQNIIDSAGDMGKAFDTAASVIDVALGSLIGGVTEFFHSLSLGNGEITDLSSAIEELSVLMVKAGVIAKDSGQFFKELAAAFMIRPLTHEERMRHFSDESLEDRMRQAEESFRDSIRAARAKRIQDRFERQFGDLSFQQTAGFAAAGLGGAGLGLGSIALRSQSDQSLAMVATNTQQSVRALNDISTGVSGLAGGIARELENLGALQN